MANKSYNRPLEHKEYIKLKYLAQNESKNNTKNIKKKKVLKKNKKIRIFDDDIGLKNIEKTGSDEELYFGTKEEKPIIAEVVDERPLHMRRKDVDTNRWKVIGLDGEEVDNNYETNKSNCDKRLGNTSEIKLSSNRHKVSKSSESKLKSRNADKRSDSDLSPERNTRSTDSVKHRYDSDSDLSPQRHRSRRSSDKTRETKNSGSDSRRHDSDSDLSPPRTQTYEKKLNDSKKRRELTLDGKRSGLSDAKFLREELMSTKRREQKLFNSVSDEILGKNAKTVFRDPKSGRIRDVAEEEKLRLENDSIKEKIEFERKAKYEKWNKGLVQTKQTQQKIESDLHEMSKPLARYEGDIDLDQMLKEKERDDDPMLATIKKNKAKQNEKQGIKLKPSYKGPPPPLNRFNISPGYRWDGVDRTNGFEKKYFERIANKESTIEEAYRWSTQDM